MLSELKKFKAETVLILNYSKRNDRQIFHSSTKLIASDLDIDKAFKFIHQSIMAKLRYYEFEDWIVLDAIIFYSVRIFECLYIEKKWG